MATNHTSLDAAATERKARLAKLASLKRKQPSQDDENNLSTSASITNDQTNSFQDNAHQHLSGRNYDPEARGPRLGFETAPSEGKDTLELRAKGITDATREKERKEQLEDKPLDLFTLQPKKPNWDLKRDLAKKTDVLDQRTDNAIARFVRERIEGQKQKQDGRTSIRLDQTNNANGDGLTGVDLVEGIRMREKEEANDERREEQEIEGDD